MGAAAMTVREAARRLGCHKASVYRLIHDGILPATKIDRVGYRVTDAAVDDLLARSSYTPRQQFTPGPANYRAAAPLIDASRPPRPAFARRSA